jgi:uncharacterized membrane protein
MTYKKQNRWLWPTAFFLALIGVVMVIRRTIFLIPVLQNRYVSSPSPPGMPNFPEDGFVNHPWLTLIHILPAFLFILLGLLQFVKTIRTRYLSFHRWNGRVLLVLGAIIGTSGIIMSYKMAISGVSEIAAITFFGTLFLVALAKGFVSIRQRKTELHREWMIRAFAIGMAVTTTRPIVGIFFATSRWTGLGPHDFFGTALWIGFTLHLIAAEVWINFTRNLERQQQT